MARRTEARLLAGGLGIMIAIWLFLGLTGEVREQETAPFDRSVLLAFRVPGDPATPVGPRWLLEAGRDVTALGGFTVLALVSLMAVLLLVLMGRRVQALIFGLTVASTQISLEILKQLVGRARPDVMLHHDFVYSASFPSGHAAMTPVVYLTLAGVLAAGVGRRSVKAALLAVAALLVLLVGLSRVYLGVHWPTDVLAGWTMGIAIALAATLALHRAAPKVVREATSLNSTTSP